MLKVLKIYQQQTQNAQSQVCCECHHQNSFSARKLTGPSHAEGSGILSSVADTRPNYPYKTDGAGFDIHSAIGKLPAPKKGWTLPGHNYTGPYNPLEQQLKYNPETGEIIEIYQQPTGPTDAVSMQHDVDYSSCAFRKQKYGEKGKKKMQKHCRP